MKKLLRYGLYLFFFFTLFGCTEKKPSERKWDAAGYSINSKWQKLSANTLIENYPWTGQEKVLDIGSGDGKVSSEIASKVPTGTVMGIDRSKEMVLFASDKFAKQAPNLFFYHQNVEDLDINEKFDLVTSFTAMHLVSDQEKALQKIASVLNPGGRILMQFPISHGFGSALERVQKDSHWSSYFKNFSTGWNFKTKDDYYSYLKAAKLHPLRIEITRLDEIYQTPIEFSKSVSYWLPHLQALPEDQKRPFLQALLAEYVNEFPLDNSGRVHYLVERLEVEAIKQP